jgi:hypothetical protein
MRYLPIAIDDSPIYSRPPHYVNISLGFPMLKNLVYCVCVCVCVQMKSLEKKTLRTGGVRGVMGASPICSVKCNSSSSEISPLPSPECCTEHLLTQEIDPSRGTDASSDSNVAGLSDEELIAMLAGCAAPTGRQTRGHQHQSWTSCRVYLPAGPPPRPILDLDDEAAAAAIESEAAESCFSFLHLEGCMDALDLLQDEALVCQAHTLDDQDQHSTLCGLTTLFC